MSIEIRNVHKQFGNFHALRDVSLQIASGELLALLGPSGCGKTTLLRIIAGLETPDQGSIWFSGADTTDVHVRSRNVGFVFQHYALFRHMRVFDNVAFGLRMKPRATRPSEAQIREKVHALLALVQLDWLADRYPAQLSGGQRQRIALARALAVEPQVLLLDEPFGALDAKVRKELRRWLRRLHDELHVTSIFVTHDQAEALEVADRVVLMHAGQVEQVGAPQEVWNHPASPFVYGFLGDVNVLHGRVRHGIFHLATADEANDAGDANTSVRLPAPEHAHAHNAPALAYVRPHAWDVQRAQATQDGTPDSSAHGIAAQLTRAMLVGPFARLELRPLDTHATGNSTPLEVHISAQQFASAAYRTGETLQLTPHAAHVFLA